MVVISAILTIIGAAATGWFYGIAADRYWYDYTNPISVTPNRLGLAVLGGCVGILIAGSLYGAFAALFEIHRHLSNLDPSVRIVSDTIERSPTAPRTEPRLI